MVAAAGDLLAASVGVAVAIHAEAGGVVATAAGTESMGALTVPAGLCQGANGAGLLPVAE